jgi:hypothetical protein
VHGRSVLRVFDRIEEMILSGIGTFSAFMEDPGDPR